MHFPVMLLNWFQPGLMLSSCVTRVCMLVPPHSCGTTFGHLFTKFGKILRLLAALFSQKKYPSTEDVPSACLIIAASERDAKVFRVSSIFLRYISNITIISFQGLIKVVYNCKHKLVIRPCSIQVLHPSEDKTIVAHENPITKNQWRGFLFDRLRMNPADLEAG